MGEDERRKKAIHSFFKAYRELQKCESVRLRAKTKLGGETLIEITKYCGCDKGIQILRIHQDNEAIAYEQATRQLERLAVETKANRKAG